MAQFIHPEALIDSSQLQAQLDDPALRIFDCTTYLLPADPSSDLPYTIDNGRTDYDRGHIPGSGFIDLQADLSDNDTALRFTFPTAERFAAAMSGFGVGRNNRVVLYSADSMQWATRVWWMLRVFGFDNAAVLDGGLPKWIAENRPLSTEPCVYPPAEFAAHGPLRPELVADKTEVLAAVDHPGTLIVNALKPEFHQGLEPSRYGRPGRIPDSVNVPAGQLIDAADGTLVSAAAGAAEFAAVGVRDADKIIAYCGGGIAATLDLFVLWQLGHKNLTLYDASMGEWARDHTLPIETSS